MVRRRSTRAAAGVRVRRSVRWAWPLPGESFAVPRVLILATALLLRRRDDDTAIGYVPFFTSLKIDGAVQSFVAV
jgi:hypothetical protein